MGITRTGHRYPKKDWAVWRDGVLYQLRNIKFDLIDEPCIITVNYYASDKRRKDVPGMLDALYHCLERSGMVRDDVLLRNVHWLYGYDKDNPRVEISIEPEIQEIF